MKTLALIFNIASLAFTLLAIAGEASTKTIDVVLTLLAVLVPIITIVAVARPTWLPGSGTASPRLAAVANLVLLAFVCRAVIGHPSEPGFASYAVLMVVTPLLSAVALFRFKPSQPARV